MTLFARVIRNAGWNLLGNLLPLAAAFVAIPFLLMQMGTERFGLMTLAWVLVGYFSLFDFGLGRALTKMVAERNVPGLEHQLSSLCSTGIALVCALGLCGALLAAAAMPWAEAWVQGVSEELRKETIRTLFLVVIGVPFVVVSTALQGIMEGFERFRSINFVRIPAGVAMFFAPCVSVWYSPELDRAVATLLATRLVVLVVHLLQCRRLVHMSVSVINRSWLASLLNFGGWLTVSNVIGPVIVYVDRFIVGALLSAAVVTYYTVPFEIIARLLVFPIAITAALFPVLSQTQAGSPLVALQLRQRAIKLILFLVLPIAAVGIIVAEPIFRLWLGAEFSGQCSKILQILLVGFVFNSIAQIPLASLQGHGRTRATALLHMMELPIYLWALVALVKNWQLEGAAIAWSIRAILDCVALFYLLYIWERRLRTERQTDDVRS